MSLENPTSNNNFNAKHNFLKYKWINNQINVSNIQSLTKLLFKAPITIQFLNLLHYLKICLLLILKPLNSHLSINPYKPDTYNSTNLVVKDSRFRLNPLFHFIIQERKHFKLWIITMSFSLPYKHQKWLFLRLNCCPKLQHS